MKRFLSLVLLAILTMGSLMPAHAQYKGNEESARRSRIAQQKRQKMLKKALKKQQKAMKKAQKAQRKRSKKANKEFRKKHGL